jgi:DGQHR domain-containing protein
MATDTFKVQGFVLQNRPKIFVAAIPGNWLLKRTTPSWRIDDPDKGFQRVVKEDRAREIALAVLEQQRTFPSSIVLATDKADFQIDKCEIAIPVRIKFLIVDGQHRLWAQKYSNFEAVFSCVVHVGLSEIEMARLFLEINDNQKRVPSSLRWDLVRLVRPEDDPYGIAAVEMIYLLATEKESPLFQRIDLTGEQSEIQLKQGSLAPDIKGLVSKRSPLHDLAFEEQYNLTLYYITAIRDLDPDNWGKQESLFYGARVLRALLRLFPDIIRHTKKPLTKLNYQDFMPYLRKIDERSLGTEEIRAAQGSAGIKAIYDQMYKQVFG